MKNVFKELLIVSYKRNKDFKDILVHSKHSIQFYNRENECKKCGKNCTLCKHLIESSKVKDNEGKIYNIHVDINCTTTSVIYCIFCTKCDNNIYVGQTGDTFYQRMLLNFSKIRTKKTKDPVANHSCNNNHTVDKYKVIGIERVNGDVILKRSKRIILD